MVYVTFKAFFGAPNSFCGYKWNMYNGKIFGHFQILGLSVEDADLFKTLNPEFSLQIAPSKYVQTQNGVPLFAPNLLMKEFKIVYDTYNEASKAIHCDAAAHGSLMDKGMGVLNDLERMGYKVIQAPTTKNDDIDKGSHYIWTLHKSLF